MGRKWRDDLAATARCMTAVKRILGEHLIIEGDITEDAQQNTDLRVLCAGRDKNNRDVRIGVRLRRAHYLGSYGNEFTIRSERGSGVETELDKILSGWGSHFFYGFMNEAGDDLLQWHLCDLHVFRLWYTRRLRANAGGRPGDHRDNHDGSSGFEAFGFAALPADFVLATSRQRLAVIKQVDIITAPVEEDESPPPGELFPRGSWGSSHQKEKR